MRYLANTFLPVIFWLAVAVGFAPRAEALPTSLTFGPIGFDQDGVSSGAGGATIDTFFFQAGNALALGAVPAFADFTNSGTVTPFDTLLQTQLGSMQDTIGPSPAISMLPGTEITMMIKAPQQISTVVGAVTNSILAPGAPNVLELWYHAAANADDLAGTGFNDGMLILSASITALSSTITITPGPAVTLDQIGTDDYPGVVTLNLSGPASFTATVNYLDPSFFLSSFTTVNFSTTLSSIFTAVDPAAQFDGIVPVTGLINGQDGPDIRYQSTSELRFVIPEPSSLGLMLLGFSVLLRYRRGLADKHAQAGTLHAD